jgi:phosphoribosylamine--glycine ligase
MPLKILILDCEFVGVDFALKCQRWGHEVVYFQAPGTGGARRKDGDGLLTKVYDLDQIRKKWLGWADLIVPCDNVKYLDMLEPFRKIGYPVFSPSAEAAELEVNRETGQKAMAKAGIPIIESKTFHDYDSAIAYVKKQGKPMVSKPSGEADKALSYVSNNAADLVYMMERWKKNPKYVKSATECGFIVQEKKKGIELAIGGWFGPSGWSKYLTLNAEYKKLHNGDLGVNTGEQGTLVSYVTHDKLFDQILKPMTAQLEALEYTGYIDNNAIIDPDTGDVWPMEFTCRFGWPLFDNQNALHDGDPAQWMLDLLNGKDTLKVRANTPCVSVVMTIPDYPYSHHTAKEIEGIPVYNAEDTDHIHPKQMMLAEDVPVMVGDKVVSMPNYATSGDYVLVATGCGENITGARKSAYAAIRKVKIPNSPAYRTDIGVGRLTKQLPDLHRLGYAKGWDFA